MQSRRSEVAEGTHGRVNRSRNGGVASIDFNEESLRSDDRPNSAPGTGERKIARTTRIKKTARIHWGDMALPRLAYRATRHFLCIFHPMRSQEDLSTPGHRATDFAPVDGCWKSTTKVSGESPIFIKAARKRSQGRNGPCKWQTRRPSQSDAVANREAKTKATIEKRSQLLMSKRSQPPMAARAPTRVICLHHEYSTGDFARAFRKTKPFKNRGTKPLL